MMNTTTTQSIRSTNKFPSHMSEDDTSSISALLNPEELSSSSSQKQQANKHNRQSLRIKSHEAPAKPKRKRISQEQFQALSELFEQTDTPNYELREKLALKLNMTNREVQVWFQNRRAKFNRVRLQEQRNQQLFNTSTELPSLSYHEDSFSSTSSSSSSTPTSPYPTLSPDMAPLEILAMAADYVQRCDQEQEEAEQASKKRRLLEEEEIHHHHNINTQKSWRPWL
ncbi:homeobox domain-containing protein [Circinella umbellata]|nr:homeobox domain-containing protein [Circinella umbellata]